MRIVNLIHIRCLYQVCGMLFVDAKEILKKIHTIIVGVIVIVTVVMRRIRIKISAKTMPRIMWINAIRFGIMCIDNLQIIVAASVLMNS